MAVEARQSAFTNGILGLNAFSSAFETPLSINEVVSLVAPFIVSVPSGTVLEALGFSATTFALPQTDVVPFTHAKIGSMLNFGFSDGNIVMPSGVNSLFCAFTSGTSKVFSAYTPGSGCQVPSSLDVAAFVFVQISVSQDTNFSSLVSAVAIITVVV